jgi:hypothetical protein
MSQLSKLRKRIGWERDVPRCKNCTHIKFGQVVLQDSMPVGMSSHLCLKHSFPTRPESCCDTWESKSGERIAGAAELLGSAGAGVSMHIASAARIYKGRSQ